MVSRRFGWHSGTLTCQDVKCRGDLYVTDDIIFSDVSAGQLGVTGGIDMQLTTSAIGIDMGGTHSTSAINIDGTSAKGIVMSGTGITRGIDIQVTPGTADRQLYMVIDYTAATKEAAYITAKSANNSGEVVAVRARAEQQHASANGGEARGVYGQGVATAAKFAGTVTGVFGNAIAKGTSDVTTIRAGFFEAESENTPTSITNIYGIHTRCKSTVSPGTDFILHLMETQKMGGGIPLTSFMAFKTTTWSAGNTVATYVIDMAALVGTVTSIMNFGAVTATNLLEVDASGDGGVTVSTDGMTKDPEGTVEDGYITILVGSTGYQIPIWSA
jgi:hypothetical protein